MKESGNDKLSRKANVLSVRLSDDELADVITLMGTTHKRKSEILKDALNLYVEKITSLDPLHSDHN